MKEATKTGVTLLQRLKEQHNILRLKSLLSEESEDPEDSLQSVSETENQELEETENDEVLLIEQEEKHDEERGMKRPSIPMFVPMFDQLESRTKPIEETRKKEETEEEDASQTFSSQPLSDTYFLRGMDTHSSIPSCSTYQKGSPIFIGEVAVGTYTQRSPFPSRSSSIFEDVGGIARNAYEVFLRLQPIQRPMLVGTIGKDERGSFLVKYHAHIGDDLAHVKREKGNTQTLWGVYDSMGCPETELRMREVCKIHPSQIAKIETQLRDASQVFIDSSLSQDTLTSLTHSLAGPETLLLVDPGGGNLQSLLASQILRRTDYVLPSIEELWELAVLSQPNLRQKWEEWREKCRTKERGNEIQTLRKWTSNKRFCYYKTP